MANKALDSNGLLYFGKEYYKKLQERFVAIESGKALSTNDYTTGEKEKLAGIEAGADVNIIEKVKVNGVALTPNSNKEVDVTIAESTNNGKITVNGTDVNIHGLGSAAYTEASAYDAAGAAAAVLGTNESSSNSMTVYGVKAYVDEALGNGGNVATQIENAIGDLDASVTGNPSGNAALGGTMVAGSVQVVEADGVITGVNVTGVEVEPAGAAAAAQAAAEAYANGLASNYDAAGAADAVLGDSNDTASDMTVYGVKAALDGALASGGAVESAITSAINDLDKADTAVTNQFVTAVSEADGIITVSRAQPTAANISVSALDHVSAGDLQTVLGALEDAIDAGGTGSVVTMSSSTEDLADGVLKSYTIYQGEQEIGTIDIPKDFLVKSGQVREATASDTGFNVGDKILDFEINTIGDDETSSHILISVADLVDAYTGGNGINVDSNNEITAVVDSTSESFLTVGSGGLKLAGVQTAIDAGRDAAKSYADGLKAAMDADLDASGNAANGGVFVVSGVTEVDGILTGVDSVEVEQAGAAASALASAQSYVNTEIAKLDADLDASGTAQHSGVFVMAGVTEVDGKITAVDSVEVEVAGAAAAAQAAAAADATSKANAAEAAAKSYADGILATDAVTASVASGSGSYMTASASGKAVTVGLTQTALDRLDAVPTAIQSVSDTDGTYVILTTSKSGTAVSIAVDDSAIGTALGGKADKVSGAVNGNLAALDASGNLVDSGVSASSLTVQYMTNSEVQDVVNSCFATGGSSTPEPGE